MSSKLRVRPQVIGGIPKAFFDPVIVSDCHVTSIRKRRPKVVPTTTGVRGGVFTLGHTGNDMN